MTSIGIGALGEPVLAGLLEPLFGGPLSHGIATVLSVTVAYLLITSAHIVAGELVPKLYVIDKAEGVARRVARPMRFFRRLFTPFIVVLTAISDRILRALGVDPDKIAQEGGRRPRSSRPSSPSPIRAASSTRARPGCSPASSTCTSRRRAR